MDTSTIERAMAEDFVANVCAWGKDSDIWIRRLYRAKRTGCFEPIGGSFKGLLELPDFVPAHDLVFNPTVDLRRTQSRGTGV